MEKENLNSEFPNYKVKFMCSYGGKILPGPHDHRLSYLGGDTKILTVNRNIIFSNLIARVTALCESTSRIFLKYQLPGQDLDALISIIDDVDVEQLMYEYDLLRQISNKPARLRLFVFLPAVRSGSGPILNPDFLFGFNKEYSEIPEKVDTLVALPVPENVASDHPRDGSELYSPKQIQGISAQGSGNVTRGRYAYRAPVAAGGYYQVGQYRGVQRVAVNSVSNREQPVCDFLPVMTLPAQEQKGHMGGHVSTNHTEG